ncbi:TPA: hypothetical protein OME03_000525 [Klebsiella pneumoniae]|nr:hypothetical protein [Klebsiella pneumoniae]
MHLANTPVVSPESKKPRKGGAFVMFKLSLLIAAIAAQLMPSMNELSKLLGENQC